MQVSILAHLRDDSFTDSLPYSVPKHVPSHDLIKYLFPNLTSSQLGLLLCAKKKLDKPVGSLGLPCINMFLSNVL
jgi:hypothetical protein